MRLLDRYLFRELLTPLVICLAGIEIFISFFIVFGDADKIQEAKLHIWETVEYAGASSMSYISVVLPVALLLALLWALTEQARHNEITAMRAAGISLWRVGLPYLVVGLATGAALFALNEFIAPHSMNWADRLLNRYVHTSDDNTPAKFQDFASRHRQWHFKSYNVATTEMLEPEVTWKLPDGSSCQFNAARAINTNGVWTFFNATEVFFPTNAYAPPVPVALTNAAVLTMPQFDETPAQIRSEIKIDGYLNKYQNHGVSRIAEIPLAVIVNYLRLHPDLPPATASELLTQFYGRLAAPWTCVAVVLIAIPFGATTGRRNLFFGVAGSIFICFTFFVLQSVSLAFGSGGELPAWLAAWLPNIFFAATGLFLMTRVR
ncbi:MAG TPA: LptF/LptG family permease [Verrucomicrobiae bacterium]|nr:LptF/LptG family permease [Verrucomicrobiae bacterium]